MADPLRKEGRFTYRDYVSWPEDERWELIDGVAYDMSPAPSRRHQDILGALHLQIRARLAGHACRVYLAPFDVRLPDASESDDEVATVVQPDLVVVCDPNKLDDAGCLGAPDLAIEILSPSTAYKDQTAKLKLYERHGVREYWVVNPEADSILVYRLGGDRRYGRPQVFLRGEGVTISTVPEVTVDLGAVFGD